MTGQQLNGAHSISKLTTQRLEGSPYLGPLYRMVKSRPRPGHANSDLRRGTGHRSRFHRSTGQPANRLQVLTERSAIRDIVGTT
jgi:hypothetical protein